MRIGVDLGGTKTEGIVLDEDGRELARERCPTPAERGYEAIVDNVAALVRRLEATAGDGARVGVGTPGAVSRASGLMKNCNTTSLNGRPLREDLSRALGRDVHLANDANCFALAEALQGAGRGHEVVFGVILGTGVGGGLVVRGVAHDGPNGIAGEWGHNVLEPEGPPCYCGRHGCVETLLSGPGLSRDHAAHGGASADAAAIARAARDGDGAARASMTRYVGRLGRALATVINIVDPDLVVLGGGLSAVELLYDELPAALAPHVFSDVVATRVVRNHLGDSAGVFGAAWL